MSTEQELRNFIADKPCAVCDATDNVYAMTVVQDGSVYVAPVCTAKDCRTQLSDVTRGRTEPTISTDKMIKATAEPLVSAYSHAFTSKTHFTKKLY